MHDVRYGHTATLLADGEVLVAGGLAPNYVILETAEIYNPAIGRWRRAADMNAARSFHNAVLLQDGKVLVVGGSYLASAELYDPVTGLWSSTGSMSTYRGDGQFRSFTLSLLPNGKALVAGGFTFDAFALGSAELYDPTSGTWALTDTLTGGRVEHAATELPNGAVAVTGGYDENADTPFSVEVYDPTTETWTTNGGSTINPHVYHTATRLQDGRILIAGGEDGTYNSVKTAELGTNAR
jgi:N-acetylneuraminic acid mutarotase